MTQPSFDLDKTVSSRIFVEEKLEKAASRGSMGRVWHGLCQSVGSALDAIQLSFKPEIEKLQIQEKKIVNQMNKYGKTTREYLIEKKQDISDQLQVETDKKEKAKLQNQLKYLESKLKKLSLEDSPGALEGRLEKVQSKINQIKHEMIAVEKRVYDMEKNVDAAMRKFQGLASDDDNVRVLQGLGDVTAKQEEEMIVDMIPKVNDLYEHFSELKNDLKKDIKNDKELKARIGLIENNLHKATLLFSLAALKFDINDTKNPAQVREIKSRVEQIKQELDPEKAIKTRTESVETRIQRALKAFNLADLKIESCKEPLIKEYYDAYLHWVRSPNDMSAIRNFLTCADKIVHSKPNDVHPTNQKLFIEIQNRISKPGTSVDTSKPPIEHLNNLYGLAVELDLLKAANQEIKAMEALVRPQKEPVLMKQIKDMQEDMDRMRQFFVKEGHEAVFDEIGVFHEKLIEFANIHAKALQDNPDLRHAANNLFKSIQDLHYDCVIQKNKDLLKELNAEFESYDYSLKSLLLPEPIKKATVKLHKPIVFGEGSKLEKREQEFLTKINQEKYSQKMKLLLKDKDNLLNKKAEKEKRLEEVKKALTNTRIELKEHNSLLIERDNLTKSIKSLDNLIKDFDDKIITLNTSMETLEQQLVEVQDQIIAKSKKEALLRPVNEQLLELGKMADSGLKLLEKSYHAGTTPAKDVLDRMKQDLKFVRVQLVNISAKITEKQMKNNPEWDAKLKIIEQQIHRGDLICDYFKAKNDKDSDPLLIQVLKNKVDKEEIQSESIKNIISKLKNVFGLVYKEDGKVDRSQMKFRKKAELSPINKFVADMLNWADHPNDLKYVKRLIDSLETVREESKKPNKDTEFKKQLELISNLKTGDLKELSKLIDQQNVETFKKSATSKLAAEMELPKVKLEGVYRLREFINEDIPSTLANVDEFKMNVFDPLMKDKDYKQAAEKCDKAAGYLKEFEIYLQVLKDKEEVIAQFKEVSKDGTLEHSRLYQDFDKAIQRVKQRQVVWLQMKNNCLNHLKKLELKALREVENKKQNDEIMKRINSLEKELKLNLTQIKAVQSELKQPMASCDDVVMNLDKIANMVGGYKGPSNAKVVGPSREINNENDLKLAIKDYNSFVNQCRHAMKDLQTQYDNLNQLIAERKDMKMDKVLEELLSLIKELEFKLLQNQKIVLVQMKIDLLEHYKKMTLEENRNQVMAQIEAIDKKLEAIPKQALVA